MNSLLTLTFVAASLSSQVPKNALTTNNFDSYNIVVAQQTCGMATLEQLQSSFPMGSIVSDGYASYKVVGYSPSFGAVQGIQVDTNGNPTSQTKHWLCAQSIS